MGGETSLNSFYGAFVSLSSLVVLGIYTLVRIEAMQSKRDTVRSDILVENWLDETSFFNLREERFQLAFAVENYLDRTGRNDPDYVDWIVQMHNYVDGVESETPLKFHKCETEDYALFYEPISSVKNSFARLKERGNLFCLDRDQEVIVSGQDDASEHRRLEIIMQPCQADPSTGKVCPYNLQ